MRQPKSGHSRRQRRAVMVLITIGTDGRLLLDELPAELLAAVHELCPADHSLRRKQAIAEAFEKGTA